MEKFCDKGPKAPQDPTKKRSYIYILLNQMIESIERGHDVFSSEIYLDSERLMNKIEVVGQVTDDTMKKLVTTCTGFKKLVHSIGITVSDASESYMVTCGLMTYGSKIRDDGSRFEIICPSDGSEHLLSLVDQEWGSDDAVIGQMYFRFPKPALTAEVSVRLFLHDGYTVPDLCVDPPVDWESEAYVEMVSKSCISTGNTLRVKKALLHSQRGEDVTIAFIGGSITQGAGAVPNQTECYAYKFYRWFQQRYCSDPTKCHYIKAGIGGTSSELGLVRYEKDIEQFGLIQPDIVFVEFAVNDNGDETEGVCHESLIATILKKKWNPAVIMVLSVFANDWNLQDRLIPIGKRYHVPMVSILDAVVPQFHPKNTADCVITKRQYFYDMFHPTNEGHTIMADCLKHLFVSIDRQETTATDINLEISPAIGREYIHMHYVDRAVSDKNVLINIGGFSQVDRDLQAVERDKGSKLIPQFINNWMYDKNSEGGDYNIDLNCHALFLIMKDSGNQDFGKVPIFVDGKYFKIIDPLLVGWTHCNAILVIPYKRILTHHVVSLHMVDTSKCFTILGWSWN
ncbi:MAG: SGNH/GDSL hydrolase family protein [Peptostreptococcaceae bacterium]|nr:SGNH/GDSL hydrolase family protein [Peptostreptococcaceae bacterium]